jgi:predicted GNAT family acetyltransferase
VEDAGRRGFELSEDEHLAIWLDAQLKAELDLRPTRGVAKETRLGSRTPRVIILEDGEIAGYAELRRTGGAIELATVVVDPSMRGRGLAHQIVQQAWERWRQDPVLHRTPLGAQVDLVRATQEENGLQVVRGPLISFTRDAAMAAALVGGGFTMMPRKRRASRLWLWRSDFAALPLWTQFCIALDRLYRGSIFLFTSPKRIPHFIRHSREYRLFVRIPETAERPPPRMHMRSEREGGVPSDLMDQMEAVAFTMADTETSLEEISAWDEGE